MRKTLKKVVVSVMAAISLSAAMTTVCSNAAYGNGSISVDGKGTGTLSTSTTALYATTSRDMPSYNIYVNIYDYNTGASVTENNKGTSSSNKVFHQIKGGTFTYSKSEHLVDTSWRYLTV